MSTGQLKSEYPLAPTPPAVLLGLGLSTMAFWLAHLGASALHQFHPLDPYRWLFALPPILLAILLTLVTGLTPLFHCRGRVRLDQSGVHCRSTYLSWGELQVRSKFGQARFCRKLELTSRNQTQRLDLYGLFLPGIEELERVLIGHKLRIQSEKEPVLPVG